MFRNITLAITLLLCTASVTAQPANQLSANSAQQLSTDNESPKNTDSTGETAGPERLVGLEFDPAPFIFGGYSVSLRYSPAFAKNFSVMGSVYSSKLPDALLSQANKDNGFRNVTLNTSFAVFLDYFPGAERTGFHAGLAAFLYTKSIEQSPSGESTRFNSIYPNIRVGYLYKPFNSLGLYIDPWVNVGKEFVTGHAPSISGTEFKTDDISYIIAIHLGYEVSF